MHGVFVNSERSKTKKALRVAATNPSSVRLEATSSFGNEYDGLLSDAPDGTYTVVGPDPYRARNWYANIIKSGSKVKVA